MIKWPKIDLKASNEASYTCAFTAWTATKFNFVAVQY